MKKIHIALALMAGTLTAPSLYGQDPAQQQQQQFLNEQNRLGYYNQQDAYNDMPAYYLPPLYGSHATTPDNANIYWATGFSTAGEASAAALESCSKDTGQTCKILGTFHGSCVTYARNLENTLYQGLDRQEKRAARKAMDNCNANSPSGMCQLALATTCSGHKYQGIVYKALHDKPSDVSWEQLQTLSDQLDKRQYWGLLASSANGPMYAHAFPSKKAAADFLRSWDQCNGNCTMVATYHDTCIGYAWAPDNSKLVTAIDSDPAKAQAAAETKFGTGQHQATVNCAGRRYYKQNTNTSG